MFPFSRPIARRLDSEEGANATAVAASATLMIWEQSQLLLLSADFRLQILTYARRSVSCYSELGNGRNPTVLSREAVANKPQSGDQAQSQIILAWLLSAATGTYPSSWSSNSRQVLSLDTVTTSLSSGLNAMRVTVKT
jgi:hypothetical protein